MNAGEVLLVIVGSSAGAALINWAASWRTTKSQHAAAQGSQNQKERHEAALQLQRETHEATLRREEAHDKARETFLPVAEGLALYFSKEAYDVHADEVGVFVFPSTSRPLFAERSEVVDATRSIMWGHPTTDVREQARSIYNMLVSYWFDTDRAHALYFNEERVGLTQDEANGLEKAAEELIKVIHSPDASVQ